MMYPFKSRIEGVYLATYEDGTPFETDWNRELTQMDIDLIGRIYPGASGPAPRPGPAPGPAQRPGFP